MKAVLVIVGLYLVGVNGRIVAYRRPTRDREFTDESQEDGFSAPSISQEDIFEDNDGVDRERSLRASLYQPSYGFTKGYRWKSNGDEEVFKTKKPKYTTERHHEKYSAYGKPVPKPWKGFHFGPHQVNPQFGERKKQHRSALRYKNSYQQSLPYGGPTPVIPYYQTVQSKKPCGNQVLIGCSPTVTHVPCGYTGGSYPTPQYYNEDLIGSSGPIYPAQPYQPEPQGYNPQPSSFYQPQGSPSSPPPQPPQHSYSFRWPLSPPEQPPTPTSSPSPFQVKPFPDQQPPSPSSYQPYQPTYKPFDSQPFKTPSFAPPVNEHHNEAAPHPQPHVSAFAHSSSTPTLTTSTPSPTTTAIASPGHLPTVPADRDQNFRFAGDNPVASSFSSGPTTTLRSAGSIAKSEEDDDIFSRGGGGGGAGPKEASGDDAPELRMEPKASSTTTASVTTSPKGGGEEGSTSTTTPLPS